MLIKKMRDIAEIKIKWEDTFYFLLGQCASREPWYTRQLNDVLSLVRIGDMIIWLSNH
jgi:hypothetical protein